MQYIIYTERRIFHCFYKRIINNIIAKYRK